MTHQLLRLKQYSPAGALENIINCRAGSVTVFRANNVHLIERLRARLVGEDVDPPIEALLDGSPYLPVDHMLVGCGTVPIVGKQSASTFLQKMGVPAETAIRLMRHYGLAEVVEQECQTLDLCQATRLCILAGLYSPRGILVLDSPFSAMGYEWHETYAGLIAGAASLNNKIVVVIKLAIRPECWIDNPQIIRVQVDQLYQRTIGFGGSADEINILLEKLRQTAKSEGEQEQPAERSITDVDIINTEVSTPRSTLKRRFSYCSKNPHLTMLTMTRLGRVRKARTILIALTIIVAILAFVKVIKYLTGSDAAMVEQTQQTTVESGRVAPVEPEEQPGDVMKASKDHHDEQVAKDNIADPPHQPKDFEDLKDTKFALSSYPVEIQSAISNAFLARAPGNHEGSQESEGTGNQLNDFKADHDRPNRFNRSRGEIDFLRALQSVGGGERSSVAIDDQDFNDQRGVEELADEDESSDLEEVSSKYRRIMSDIGLAGE